MASSRHLKGSVVSRVRGLLKSGVMKQKPIWFDVTTTFPPLVEADLGRESEVGCVKKIVYPEDAIRRQVFSKFKSEAISLWESSKKVGHNPFQLGSKIVARGFSSNSVRMMQSSSGKKGSEDSEPSAKSDQEQEIIKLTRKLLNCVITGDFEGYSKLCDIALTCFEPEAKGNLLRGLDFHQFYMDNVFSKMETPINTTLLTPCVHILGEEAAVICYVRLSQYLNSAGLPITLQSEETRVWDKRGGQWVCVHFHRSGALTVLPNE